MNTPILFIMAAGHSTRYKKSKQLEQVGQHGETLMDFSIRDAIEVGFRNIVILTNHKNDHEMQSYYKAWQSDEVNVAFVTQLLDDTPVSTSHLERAKLWGTAHCVYAARKELNGVFTVINADDYYGKGAFQTAFKAMQNLNKDEASIILFQIEKTLLQNSAVKRGICYLENDLLTKIEEFSNVEKRADQIFGEYKDKQVELALDQFVSMNFFIFHPGIIEHLETGLIEFIQNNPKENEEFLLPELISELIEKNKLQVNALKTDAKWIGLTHPEDKVLVQETLKELAYR